MSCNAFLILDWMSAGGSGDSTGGSEDSVGGSGDSAEGSGDSVWGYGDSARGSRDSVGGSGDSVGGSGDSGPTRCGRSYIIEQFENLSIEKVVGARVMFSLSTTQVSLSAQLIILHSHIPNPYMYYSDIQQ